MTAPANRRGFLRGLTTLPLIGGSVALIGKPSAAAVPVTGGMLATYSAWLFYERRALAYALGHEKCDFIPCINPGSTFHFPMDGFSLDGFGQGAIARAPVVLAAAGCPLTDARAEEQWGDTFRPIGREGTR